MKCVMCKHGETRAGVTSLLLTRDEFTLVMRDVPAEVCEICGEDYLDNSVVKRLYHLAESMKRQGAVFDVRKYQVEQENLCTAKG